MLNFWSQRRPTRSSRAKRRTLWIESLAARITMHGSGLGVSDPLPWFDPGALTYSFAPDGTDVAGQRSSLFAVLNELGEPSTWQAQVDAAIDAWLKPLGVKAHAVDDSGVRLGAAGLTQGDVRFGDIRIAAIPLSGDVIATSVPHSAIVQGTWAGDILLNSNADWTSLRDVFAVALHEVGHVLGLEHSLDPKSVMFVHGVHDITAPTDADFAILRDLYSGIELKDERGPRSARSERDGDAFETAIGLSPVVGNTIRYTSGGTLTADTGKLIFRLDPLSAEAPALKHLNVALQSVGTQHLIAEVDVFTDDGQLVDSQILHHSEDAVVLHARNIKNDETYYVRVRAADTSPTFQVGDFDIVVDYATEVRESREIADVRLGSSVPVLTQRISIASSRFVHLNFDAESSGGPGARVWATLLGADGESLAQATLMPGQSRSMPIVFLPAGDYTIELSESVGEVKDVGETRINVFVDEISIDVGPGVTNPTGQPYLWCDDAAADPQYCYAYQSVEISDPYTPATLADPYTDPDWWIYYGSNCGDYLGPDLEYAQQYDSQWWEFHALTCVANPTPPNTPPNTPPPTTNNVSPWQNPVNIYDVSGDTAVTALGALIVINVMNRNSSTAVSVTDTEPVDFADVNGDYVVSALDALIVINVLSQQGLSAEGEAAITLMLPVTKLPGDLMVDLLELTAGYSHEVGPKLF